MTPGRDPLLLSAALHDPELAQCASTHSMHACLEYGFPRSQARARVRACVCAHVFARVRVNRRTCEPVRDFDRRSLERDTSTTRRRFFARNQPTLRRPDRHMDEDTQLRGSFGPRSHRGWRSSRESQRERGTTGENEGGSSR
jgi:hypothetical protein